MKLKGLLISGHGVASGKGGDARYPEGTIQMQIPFFKKLGLELSNFYPGTLNIDISPFQFRILQPKHFFKNINWSPFIPPENFYFFDVSLRYNNLIYNGLIYMPDPATKTDHPQKPSMLELVMPKIDELKYGEAVEIEVLDTQIQIYA
ncbi:MAG: hypothetical protein SFY32_08695 [Bacteroidota bacterium]|nr:hypothetical protein [Bacteroidota bacterium]